MFFDRQGKIDEHTASIIEKAGNAALLVLKQESEQRPLGLNMDEEALILAFVGIYLQEKFADYRRTLRNKQTR